MILLAFAAIAMTAWSQRPNVEKMSVTTQMFLDQMEDTIVNRQSPAGPSLLPGLNLEEIDRQSLVAKPEIIDGQAYISAFVRIKGDKAIGRLTDLGVKIQCQFDNELITALIPVDKIDDVAALDEVKRIKVAERMKTLTDKAREATNVDDVLTNSPDAIAAGLYDVYDGSGVILGIIDTGIDYQHIAFQGTNGTRVKRIYDFTYTQTDYYGYPTDPTVTEWTGTGTMPTTDDNTEDHGTHTSSIAGGSSVIINGSNVTVTDDHANANYGGMAPGADLYLAGIKGLNDTYIANAFKKMSDYADEQNQPLVVNNSWGSQIGPHDGTDDVADIVARYYGDNHPNKICLFASSNDGGKSKDGEGGGYHLSGNATSAQPLSSILRSATYSNTDGGYFYQGVIASAWARNTGVTKLGVKILVLDANTGEVKTSVTVSNQTTSVSGLSTYYSGTLGVYYDQVESNKTQIVLYSSSGLESRSTSQTTQNGSTYYKSNYTLAVQFYPISGASNTLIDVWGGSYGYFTSHLMTNNYNWTAGNDDMSVSDEATIPDAISIGAYVTKNQITNYNGTTYDFSGTYTMGDIAYFSSYATADQSPTGLQYPWITAPGARLVAGVNHNHTTSVDNYSYYGSNYNYDLVVNNSNYPYAAMQGTSMACPTAAGIVALWLQAAQEVGKTMTTSDIKEVMRETAIIDQWTTTGPNACHFGNGKINALAGIEYILGGTTPTIIAIPTEVTFDGVPGNAYTATVNVMGRNLVDDIIATLNDNNGVYSINTTNLGQGGDLVITFAPDAEGEFTATITLTSIDADPVTITIHGTAYVHHTTLTSAMLEVPVYRSEAQAVGTYRFTRTAVDEDTGMNLSYGGGNADVQILAKDDESIVRYDLHRKVGSNGTWTYPNGTAVATATHDASNPKIYTYNSETFTIPSDATQMWLPMSDESANPSDIIYYVPVTVANGVVTQENTYGAAPVQVETHPVSFNVSVGGSKSDKSLGGHWTQDLNGDGEGDVEYCVYTPVVTILDVSPAFSETHVLYRVRAWLTESPGVTFYDYDRFPNQNDPSNSHIEGTTPLTLPKLLVDTINNNAEMTGSGPFIVGYDWNNPNAPSPWAWGDDNKLMNSFAAPSNLNGSHINVVVRAYYYKVGEAKSGLRDGDDAPADGYGYGEGGEEGNGDNIPTAVGNIFTDRVVVGVKYVNIMGMQSDKPFDGVNIIVTRYSDGTITTKVLK